MKGLKICKIWSSISTPKSALKTEYREYYFTGQTNSIKMNPRNEMTEADFLIALTAYLEANPTIQSLHEEVGGFDNLPEVIKKNIDTALNVERIVIINKLPALPK